MECVVWNKVIGMENKNRSNIEVLKDLYSYSDKNVFITDYDYNVIWTNADNDYIASGINSLKSRNNGQKKSGEYEMPVNGLKYKYNLINYPNIDDGIYIIEVDKYDLIFSFLNCPEIYELVSDKTGAIRESIFEIVTSNNIINTCLEENMLYNEQKYLNLSVNSCFKLLRVMMNISELVNYTDKRKELLDCRKTDVSKDVNDFAELCKSILRYSNIIIKHEVEPDLFIVTDVERFSAMLVSFLIYAVKMEERCDVVIIKLYGTEKNVVLSITFDSLGTDENSKEIELSNRNEKEQDVCTVDSYERIIKCYCEMFDSSYMHSTNKNKMSVFTLRMPKADEESYPINLNSPSVDALTNRFSKFHIALSELTKYRFY